MHYLCKMKDKAMRKVLILILAVLLPVLPAPAQDFDRWFTGETLRIDYVFCGDTQKQAIYLQGLLKTGEWAGRRGRLGETLLRGNGQIRLSDAASGKRLYVNSFSTLFQEWVSYPEAKQVSRAFENCFQVPFPKKPVDIEIVLTDVHGKVSASLKHRVDPSDILIRQVSDNGAPKKALMVGGKSSEAIDIVILSEGYTDKEERKFFRDAKRAQQAIFSHEPFASHADAFNLKAVFVASASSGPSIPHDGQWHSTMADSHFDTFYSDRYLTSSSQQKIFDALGTVPFEHIILLVNTPVYGGGGIYNSLTIMGSDHPTFAPVLVHEFGHAFGGLGDEYAYDDMEESMYPADTEPWEPNLTTRVDFGSKWKDMIPAGTPVPTPLDPIETTSDVRRIWSTLSPEQKARLNSNVGLYEGGGYQSKGVWRPVQECRMRINECEEFCPVCARAIIRMIEYYTK